MNERLDSMGFHRKERGGAGNCFYDSAGAALGLNGCVVRERTAEYLRRNPAENKNFVCESFEKFCSGVATNGTWVNGGPEIVAASKALDRDICILGVDPVHDLYIGTRGTEPIILVYWKEEEHFTGVETIDGTWRKNKSKGIRSEQHSQFLKKELYSQKCKRDEVIMQARSKTVPVAAVGLGDVEPTCEISTLLEEEQLNFTLAASKSESESKESADATMALTEALALSAALALTHLDASQFEEEQLNFTLAVSKSDNEAKESADATMALTEALALKAALALSQCEQEVRQKLKDAEFEEMKRTEVSEDAKGNIRIAETEMELLEADKKSRAQSKHSFFRTLTMFFLACFVILRSKFPVVSGNFTSSDVNMIPQGSGTFTLSEVNMSPKGSRTQHLFSESPGGTQRTGTIFLTPESGDMDKQSRAKRQKRNSATRKRILQPDANAAANAAYQQRYCAPI